MTTINTNEKDAVTTDIDVSSNSFVGLYVQGKTGSHDQHVIVIQVSAVVSPHSGDWFDIDRRVTGTGYITADVCAKRARACVHTEEGHDSTCDVILLAR